MNKQIEEMAKDIYESKSCDTSFEENCKLLAYDLVTLGYQKVDKDKVVIDKTEYERLIYVEGELQEMNADYYNELKELKDSLKDSVILSKGAYESLSSKAKANVVNAVEIRKETAREILQWLKDHCAFAGWVLVETYFREQFGVEVDNN